MRTFIREIGVGILVAAFSTNAVADECLGLALTPRTIKIDGVEYIALPPNQAACLAKRAEQHAAQVEVVQKQDEVIRLQDKQIATASVALAAAKDLGALQAQRANDLNTLAEKQASQLDAWYRQPVFWLGVGVVGTTIIFALLRGASTSNTISVVPGQ